MNLQRALMSGLIGLSSLALSAPAWAADQSIDLSSGQASFASMAAILDGGDDVLSFTGLAPGSYNFVFSISAQFIGSFGGTVNGTPFATATLGPVTAGAMYGVDSAPFTVVLTGMPTNALAVYNGTLTATLVPEPGSYALMGAGLAVLAWMRRRRPG